MNTQERNKNQFQRLCRFNTEGLIAEHWGFFNVAGMMRQLS
jgi:hypothetical protein